MQLACVARCVLQLACVHGLDRFVAERGPAEGSTGQGTLREGGVSFTGVNTEVRGVAAVVAACDVAGGAMARKFRKISKKLRFSWFLMIFYQSRLGEVGERSRDINIYTCWIDLDVLCTILKESGVVSGTPGLMV